ncbi:hypothetical protein DERP_007254 [Dermatophagoides pteronyssinus]|uniref:Uncharacterized protein n=1 Tax=Dermatophagoides pteronyssinus TaxID=6956 RepID=A0ABQ8J418_DERPT|nr:hypothetical protein DERP_007254 [Dermatophagoides pteronyssinus]
MESLCSRRFTGGGDDNDDEQPFNFCSQPSPDKNDRLLSSESEQAGLFNYDNDDDGDKDTISSQQSNINGGDCGGVDNRRDQIKSKKIKFEKIVIDVAGKQ